MGPPASELGESRMREGPGLGEGPRVFQGEREGLGLARVWENLDKPGSPRGFSGIQKSGEESGGPHNGGPGSEI